MPNHARGVAGPRTAFSPNTIVTLLCAGMAVFMLVVASICGSLMRSDAAMVMMARPKICLIPARATNVGKPPPMHREILRP